MTSETAERPVWTFSEDPKLEGHTCCVEVSTTMPDEEDWHWSWEYLFWTMKQQLGEQVDTWELPDFEENWYVDDEDGSIITFMFNIEGAECALCDEDRKQQAEAQQKKEAIAERKARREREREQQGVLL